MKRKNSNIRSFQRSVWSYYKSSRRSFPWRNTRDPYRILVSEVMLQQTQTARVVPKYEAFIHKLPTIDRLRRAKLSTVLKLWSGLGYNRRAKALHQLAIEIQRRFSGKIPRSTKELLTLPGIGPYTAGAVLCFAYDKPEAIIETNIRTVFIHHFFRGRKQISDAEILSLISKTIDRKNPREWYYALMDYGVFLKSQGKGMNERSRHYVRQTPLKGSLRETRGIIMKLLANDKMRTTSASLRKTFPNHESRLKKAVETLVSDGLIVVKRGSVSLPR